MTTKPKAKRFRIRRSPSAAAGATAASGAASGAAAATALREAPDPHPAGSDDRPAPVGTGDSAPKAQPRAMHGDVASSRETRAETDIDAIRREAVVGGAGPGGPSKTPKGN